MKIKGLILTISVVILLFHAYPQDIGDQDDPFTCAVIAFNEGFYEISLEFLDKYFEKAESRKNQYALFLYGINLLKCKKYDKSLEKFEEFTKLFPDSKYSGDVWKYRVTLKTFLNMPYEAWNTYRDGLPVYGREPEIEKNIGYMLLNEAGKTIASGDIAEAKKILNEMEQIFSETGIIHEMEYYRGLILYQENDFAEGVKSFLNALTYFKNQKIEPEILLKIGDCFFNMKNYQEGERYYDYVISRFHDSPQAEWARLQKALIYKRNMKYKEARKLLATVIKNTRSNEILLRAFWELGKISELEDKKDQAIYWYEKILQTATNNQTLLKTKLQIGYIYFNQKQYEKSIEIFSEYLKHSNDPDVMYALGLAFYNSNKNQQAINTWELLINQNPEYPLPVQVLKAMYGFYRDSSDREKMKKIFNKIWETYPEDNFILTEGIIFINEILNTDGIDVANSYLKKMEPGNNRDLLFLNAKILYLTGNIDESEKILKNIDRKSIFAAEALYMLIKINIEKSRIKDAQTYYVKLLAAFPKTVWAQKARQDLSTYKTR
ncbi:MAG: tetratricopeptide repeat protein [Candidatus Omnitrophica bacterium]|nr:tetratricopeptide repeat protein [Candidatus Omnitrophota bacterium]MCM8788551.1 tetratricopeptide repeat protein [Candidatus Omnitrophota bacterium]